MYKSQLTEAQKESFKFQFEQIIFNGPDKVKNIWNGKIEWNRDIPVFNDSIHLHLTGKSAQEYEDLIKKLNNRNL